MLYARPHQRVYGTMKGSISMQQQLMTVSSFFWEAYRGLTDSKAPTFVPMECALVQSGPHRGEFAAHL